MNATLKRERSAPTMTRRAAALGATARKIVRRLPDQNREARAQGQRGRQSRLQTLRPSSRASARCSSAAGRFCSTPAAARCRLPFVYWELAVLADASPSDWSARRPMSRAEKSAPNTSQPSSSATNAGSIRGRRDAVAGGFRKRVEAADFFGDTPVLRSARAPGAPAAIHAPVGLRLIRQVGRASA